MIKAFIASILGGLGSLTGAVAGGFLLGTLEIYLAAYLPENWMPFHNALVLGLVVLVLVVRPDGLIATHKEKSR